MRTIAFYSKNEDLFKPTGIITLMNDFYLAVLIQSFCMMNRDISFDKIRELACSFDLDFYEECFEAPGSLSLLRYDSTPSSLTTEAKTQQLCLVEADLDFEGKNFYCQCPNINKQGIYLEED